MTAATVRTFLALLPRLCYFVMVWDGWLGVFCMEQWFAILCVASGCAVAALVVLVFAYRAALAKAGVVLATELEGANVVIPPTKANFFGTRSRAGTRLRGNGVLALTDRALVFVMALPSRTLVVSLEKMVEVVETSSFNGKSIFRPLLRVAYDSDDGLAESAWYVGHVPRWISAIAAARGNGRVVGD